MTQETLIADVLIVGSGFAGSILARCLKARGRSVLMVEKGSHPRFALGESSTPLANLALERLAIRYQLEDLYELAAYGRWRDKLPHTMRGLKRGFTFYRQRPFARFEPGRGNEHLLMVAASPDDEIADSQWLRSEVDLHLVEQAIAEGVLYFDRSELSDLRIDGDAVRGTLESSGNGRAFEAAFVVDASGAGAATSQALGVGPAARDPLVRTRLLYSHFVDLPAFSESEELSMEEAPYPEQWSAVHHLLDCGWMYQLRFDDHRTSCGLVLDLDRVHRLESRSAGGVELLGLDDLDLDPLDWDQPEESFRRVLRRYPSLERQFERASPLRPIEATPRLQRRLARAHGRRWAFLPHTYAFFGPLFSTGMAWSLMAVERLAELLGGRPTSGPANSGSANSGPTCGPGAGPRSRGTPAEYDPRMLDVYGQLLAQEADHLENLLAAAYARLEDPSGFLAVCQLYFAVASFSETCQRMLEPGEWTVDAVGTGADSGWTWRGFLGASDPVCNRAFDELLGRATSHELSGEELLAWACRTIAPRNVAGLCDPKLRNLYPVEVEKVIERSDRLGLSARDARSRLGRLRSPKDFAEAVHEGLKAGRSGRRASR